jgi:hypothetical protein
MQAFSMPVGFVDLSSLIGGRTGKWKAVLLLFRRPQPFLDNLLDDHCTFPDPGHHDNFVG